MRATALPSCPAPLPSQLLPLCHSPAAPPARPQGLVCVLQDYGTVAEAYARYLKIKALPKPDRRGQDDKVSSTWGWLWS